MSRQGRGYNPLSPNDDPADPYDMEGRDLLKSPSDRSDFKSMSGPSGFEDNLSPPPRLSFRSSVGLIPTPGTGGNKRPPRFEPLMLRLWVVALGCSLMIIIGVGLEIALHFSQAQNGFAVPQRNVFSFASIQFLTSFFPTLVMIPLAYMLHAFDWQVRSWQPYLVLSKGNATADESILLDYIGKNRYTSIYSSLKHKHKIITISGLTILSSLLLQPLAGSLFSVRQLGESSSSTVDSIRVIGLSPNVNDLSAFASSAGFAEAAVFNNLTNPPFVYNGWAVAQFIFPTNTYLNGSMAVNTTAIQTNVNCANPITLNLNAADPRNFTIQATSVEGCNISGVSFDPTNSEQQYGVSNVPACGGPFSSIAFEPVFFWYYQQRQDNQAPDARGVFCTPQMQLFDVLAFASLNDGSLTNVSIIDNYPTPNNVTGPPLNDIMYNGLIFDPVSDVNVQARASSIKTGIPNAVFRGAEQAQGGLQSVFDDPNGFLGYTRSIYTQYLALSAKSNYFIPTDHTVSAVLTQLVPRLWIEPLSGHLLALICLVIGFTTLSIHLVHHRSRRDVYLTHEPGAIATVVSQTSRSGFGDLLMPYDDMELFSQKLASLRFRLDQRTGAIVVDDAAVGYAGPTPDARDETMMTLIGQRHRRMDSTNDVEA